MVLTSKDGIVIAEIEKKIKELVDKVSNQKLY